MSILRCNFEKKKSKRKSTLLHDWSLKNNKIYAHHLKNSEIARFVLGFGKVGQVLHSVISPSSWRHPNNFCPLPLLQNSRPSFGGFANNLKRFYKDEPDACEDSVPVRQGK
jgi:hypothetical protein